MTVEKGAHILQPVQWHAVNGQCMIDHDAVTQDTFKENISSGLWQVKTVLDA